MLFQRLSGSQRLLAQPARCFKPFQNACRRLVVQPRAAAPAAATVAADPVPVPAFKANLDFKYIKENLAAVTDNCKNRLSSAQPARVVELYDEFTQLKQEADRIRASRNENSQAMKGKLEAEQRQQLIEKGQQLKVQLEGIESKLVQVENLLQVEGQRIPNNTHPNVPLGGEDNAAVLQEVGSQRQFGFAPKDHVTLGEALGLLDFESAAEVSGSKFYYLRNAAALLELALVNWAVTRVTAKGFMPLITPDLVKEAVLEKCGFQPRADNTQVYSVAGSPLCLTGTAEVPLGGVYMDKVLLEKELPIKMVAYGHCFRTEAGAAGMAGKGLYRVHQFSKVEMFVLSTPEQSDALHQELIDIEAGMFADLGLHFKVLDMPSGDLGAPAYRKFDVEAWMPGLGRYGEISSASNCTDYQSRRLNIRYRPNTSGAPAAAADAAGGGGGNGKKQQQKQGKQKGGSGGATAYVHTLNATACAVPRMIVAILENFQQEDGSVVVPEVLRPFMGGLEVIRPPEQP